MKEGYTFSPGAVLRISGEDHEEFLQNQGTADLRGDPGLCRYCLWLDYKGKIQADAFVLKLDPGQMLLVSYACPAAVIMEKFHSHIISEEVMVTEETANWRIVSVPDDTADRVPESDDRFSRYDTGFIFRGRRLGPETVDYLLPADGETPQIDHPLTEEQAEEKRILAGMPMVPQDTADGRLNPVECGILSAVSLDKGCYLGQEVVTRVHRLQRLNRQLVQLRGKGLVPELPCEINDGDTVVGCLSSLTESGKNFTALGWLKSSLLANDEVLAHENLSMLSPCRS